jgi:hypothetical protein
LLSALVTLLAVVVSFNTLTIQNQLKNAPKTIKELSDQLDDLRSLIEPVLNKRPRGRNRQSIKENHDGNGNDDSNDHDLLFDNAHLYVSDAMRSLATIVRDNSKRYLELVELSELSEFKNICQCIYKEYSSKISFYDKTKSTYSLLTLSTTEFIQDMIFNNFYSNNEKIKEFYEGFQKLHLLKSFSIQIFIRNTLSNLSREMLSFTIPIIAFVSIITSISNYDDYDANLLRILFASSISIVILPFLILLIRVLPILYLVKDESAIPFKGK